MHKKRLVECQKKRLAVSEKREMHKKRLIECQKKRLALSEKRQIHRLKDRKAHQIRLSKIENRAIQRQRLIESQSKRLSHGKNREVHKQRLIACQRKRLKDGKHRAVHKQRLIACQRKRLKDGKRRAVHKQRLIACQRKRLKDGKRRAVHKQRLIACQRRRLKDGKHRAVHKQRLIACQRNRLNDFAQRQKHLKRLTKSQHKRRRIQAYRIMHNEKAKQNYHIRISRQNNDSRVKLFKKYNTSIKDGPYWECVSCCRLLFKSSVTLCSVDMFENVHLSFIRECCLKMTNDVVIGHLCSSCKKSLSRNERPRFSLCHDGLKFPHVPEEVKKLTSLEERFLCPRIPFMQIKTFGGNQQYSVKGRVVNVPTDVAENIEVLPRLPHQTDVIPVVLKKKKEYNSNVMFQTVRPNVILDALKVLQNCPVYKKANVSIDYSKIETLREVQQQQQEIVEDGNDSEQEENESESDCDSETEPLNIPADHTMLMSEAIVFAPGENFQPVPLFLDTDAEAMSFVKIYGGETKEYPNHMSYQEITKSEVMRSDRRVASSIDKLFYSCTFLRAQKVSNSISICMRKSSGRHNATAATVLADDFIKSITIHDSGFKVFAPDRGSPAFWEQKKKELFAMIRQLGPPTFFMTLSPAETKWAELLVVLKKVVDGVDITEDEALVMTYEEKVRLIKHEPVTCSEYFDYRLRKLFNVLKTKNSVFREYDLVDSYIRIEFQQRGSPHAHCLVWLNGAPKLNPEDPESLKQCEMFIDRFITCSHNNSELPNELIQFQVHKHTFTCLKKKKNEKKCRFGIPSFPMKETKILEPLGDSINEIELKKHNAELIKIRALLDEMYKNEQDLTYEEFLSKLSISEEDYIMAIRSSLKRPKCFLKRSLKDIRINAYNTEILALHRSNMDIQFITDVYSCAMYVLNYINKSKGGISKILRDAMKEVKKGDLTLKEKLRFLANKFLNASEFSAQEAVYYLLSLPLSMCSRSAVFINTSSTENRVSILKSKRELKQLPSNSTDIYKKGLIDHYVKRPEELKDVCLAEFAAYYTLSTSKKANNPGDDDELLDDDELSEAELHENEPMASTGVYTKRKRAKIIRYVRYNIENDESSYYREQLMLFLPWRNEQEDIINVNHKVEFVHYKDTILSNRAKFIYGDSGDDIPIDIIDAAVKDHNADDSSEEENDGKDGGNEFEVLNDRGNEADIFTDTGIDVNKKCGDEVAFPVPRLIADDDFEDMVCTLNKQQRKYMLHVLNCHKLKKIPTYECVLGGAGVGKSRLIEVIHQALLRHYNNQEGTDLESLKVLICAPTGKAAFNIKGITLHSAFVLPVNQFGGDMPPLSSSVSSSILSKLYDLKLIIIDEISMVGSKVFGQINLRLQQIFRSSEPFAGKSIIMFGDFNQLAPVGDKYIFKPDPSNPYSELVGNPLWEKFSFFELTEIMRQKDDAKFAVALNNLAEGTLTQEEVEMFYSRANHNEPSETIRLYRSNAEVDHFNESVFKKQSDVLNVNACDKVIGKVHETVKKSLLKAVKELKVSSTYGLPRTLKLSIGIHYMLTCNIKVDDGLVNGAVGVLKFIEKNDMGDVKRLWIFFTDPNVGKMTRTKVKQVSNAKGIDGSLTPIEMICKNIKPRQNTLAMIMRRQFPVVPAEAITIHKSQGCTYSSAVVNIKAGMKRNELYVALSRVTSLNGLFIRGNFVKPQKSNDEVSRVIKSAIKEKPVNMELKFLEKETNNLSIVFQNIQSLRKHHRDLKADHFLTSSSVIALVETWTLTTDCVNIDGYQEVYRVDVKKSYRHAYGIVVYCKTSLSDDIEILFEYNCEQKSTACNMVALKMKEISICLAYKPPSTSFAKVKNQVDRMIDVAVESSKKVVILGDFNIDLMSKTGTNFDSFLNSKEVRNKIVKQPSTNGMTQIDICYSNIDELSASYFESYFSYHKPIVCEICESGLESLEKNNGTEDVNNDATKQINIERVVAEQKDTVKHSGTEDKVNYTGFQNVDNVSCYANVVCQCILNIAPLQEAVMSEQNDVITNLILSFIDPNMTSLSSWEIRQLVDKDNGIEMFTLPDQQDVPEFIIYLMKSFPMLEEVAEHILCYEFKCKNCLHVIKSENEVRNVILPIYETNETKSLKKMFETSYGDWTDIDRKCDECGFDTMMTKSSVSITRQCSVIFLQLIVFEQIGHNVVKKPKTLHNLHTEIIEVNDVKFKVAGLINHHGASLSCGHYTCKIKSGNSWLYANDTKVVKCEEPKVETNAYVIVLERFYETM